MTGIVSKNLYELLGNDHDQDPDREPEPPTRAIDKPVPRSGKRDVGPQAPAEPAGGFGRRGGRGGARGEGGNERAFRDRDAGASQNRSRAPEDGTRHPDRAPRGEYRGRGRGGRGRGGRGGGNTDRQDKSGIAEHPKQAAHGWGGTTGNDELNDEKAGEAIAKAEEAEGFDTSVPPPQNADGEAYGDAEAEPEGPKSKSYEEYLAEQAEKKLTLGGSLATRKPNEGTSKKFPEGKAFARDENDENYMAGSGGKAARYREKKEKQALDMSDVDPRSYLAEDRSATRGGRGRGRGDRGDRSDRGGDRGDRSERGDRGERGGRGRGEFRGSRGGDRGGRGEFRGSRGARGGAAPPRADDSKAFPSLGGN